MRQKRIFARLGWILMLAILCVNLSGCIQNPFQITNSYESYYSSQEEKETEGLEGMAADLAVLDADHENTAGYQSSDYADLLINDSTNEVMKSYRCFERVYPASITKIMTALLVLENGNLDDEITLDHDIELNEDGAVVTTLSKGDTVTVNEAFHGLLVKSANDCAVILAEYIAGSEEKFVDMMNERAKELGATHTHFANPHGLHEAGLPHVSGAHDKIGDMAILIAEQRDLIDLKVRQSVIEYNRLNRYIAGVEDAQMRMILSLRYVNGLSWQQVVAQIGGGNTADGVRKAHDRFLKLSVLSDGHVVE